MAALAALMGLWILAAWIGTGLQAKDRQSRLIERERQQAEATAHSINDEIRRNLAYTRSIPVILSKESSLIPVLSRFGPEVEPSALPFAERNRMWLDDAELGGVARHLREVIADAGVNALFVVNAAGDCIAEATLPHAASFTGTNYADREYFQAAKRGQSGRQFAIGRITGTFGLFFSSPVIADGRFLGAVAVRTDMANFSGLLVDADAFVTDENGVIILANDPQMVMRALPDAEITDMPVAAREARYKRKDFDTVDISPLDTVGTAGLVRWRGHENPSVVATNSSQPDIIRVFVLRDLEGIEDIQRDRQWLFALLSLTGFLLISLVAGGVAYVRRNAEHRRALMEINEQLHTLASTDALTGCANRRRFLAALDAERQRGARYGAPFSLLSLDIDHFKDINDRFGHPGGDQALRHFVTTVEAMLRPTDLLGRIGGEEFAILLSQITIEEAVLAAERIRSAVEASPAPMEHEHIPFTVSIGVSQWQAGMNETSESLLGRADSALYEAKKAGRNRVECQCGMATPSS